MNETKLTKKHYIGYALGDWGGCMTFALMGSMAVRYYTDVLLIDTVLMAAILAVWNIWDAVNDPMMGAIMDKMFARKRHPQGKFRPWMFRATPMLAATAIIFWTVPSMFKGTVMIIVLFIAKLLYEACYTMFNIPYGSLLSAMANTDKERAGLSSARGVGSMIGNMVPMMIMPILIGVFGETDPRGYAIGASICAVIGLIVCFFAYKLTTERNVSVNEPVQADDIKFTDILVVLAKNRAFLALCIHGVSICTMQYVGTTVSSYIYSEVYGDIAYATWATVAAIPLSILVYIFAPKIAEKLGLEKFIRYSLLIGGAMYVALFVLHVVTFVPLMVHVIWSALAMGCAQVSILMQWGLVGEAIDYNEYLTGKRTEGSIYGTFNLTRRIGQTIGNSAALLMLGWIGYNGALDVQSDATIVGIKVLCMLVPAIFVIGSWIAFRFVWNITPEIREKMAAFKAGK